jgi:N-acetylglucosamine-6-phosphate deacetylase
LLIGTCITLDECVRYLMDWAEVSLQKAVLCVTETVAEAMGLQDRGKLEVGRRADFVVLSECGDVMGRFYIPSSYTTHLILLWLH